MKLCIFIVTAVFVFNKGEGLTCLQCKDVPKPWICNEVVDCYADESCSIEQVVNKFGETVYNLGCLSNTVCSNFANNINEQTETCSGCCNNYNLCNSKGCNQQGYPEQRGPICYNCPLHTDSGKCHKIEFCSTGEMCNIVGKNIFSETVYTSTCISKHACKPVEGNPVDIIGKRDVSMDKRSHEQHICSSCCPEDLCNKNCTTAQLFIGKQQKHRHILDPTDCADVLRYGQNKGDGIYTIVTWKTHETHNVYCDMTTDGGGWTVFQYRSSEIVDFYRNFSQYVNGFGNLHTEFWLGLKYIEEIANQRLSSLRIDVEATDGAMAYETFDHFSLSPGPAFTLHLGSTIAQLNISNIKRFAAEHNGSNFSTYDQGERKDCAASYKGGWWYHNCFTSDLNGKHPYSGIIYNSFRNSESLKTSKMMLRRRLIR